MLLYRNLCIDPSVADYIEPILNIPLLKSDLKKTLNYAG